MLGKGDFYEFFIDTCIKIKTRSSVALKLMTDLDIQSAWKGCWDIISPTEPHIGRFLPHFVNSTMEIGSKMILGQKMEIKCDLSWPLNLLLTTQHIKRYNEVFNYILCIKRLQNNLSKLCNASKEKRVNVLKIKMQFFINCLFSYIQIDVVNANYTHLIGCMNEDQSIQNLVQEHSNFLDKIYQGCFLENDPINECISTIIIQCDRLGPDSSETVS